VKAGGPLVSIVLPTYNGSRYLRKSIESCLKQTYHNIEVVVVDDCSTDTTPAIVKSFQDPRLHYHRNIKNQRLPRSLNIGFTRAKGEYLTWTSDDNEYSPEAIQEMLSVLEKNPDADFVYADYWAYYEDTGLKELKALPDRLDMRRQNQVGACFLYTRRVYETIGDYNPYYEIVEDYDYFNRITKRFRAVHCAKPLYLYLYHSKSLTSVSAYNQWLWDRLLKYESGFISRGEMVSAIDELFFNAMNMKKTRNEKIRFYTRTVYRMFRVSFRMGASLLPALLSKSLRQ